MRAGCSFDVQDILRRLQFEDPVVVQSMYIFKVVSVHSYRLTCFGCFCLEVLVSFVNYIIEKIMSGPYRLQFSSTIQLKYLEHLCK